MNIRRGLWETRVIEPVFYDDEGGVLLTGLPPFLSRHRLIEKTPKASDFVEKQSSRTSWFFLVEQKSCRPPSSNSHSA
ncbi:hypothetical protein QC763_0061380 [Podospora pseudopauciseta]|uniref:Uncharacterized protein n=1 Tax=Podospora pseudopauciseta TaxID=2093780 RepID=A0ABR0HBA5_9PEZI|nr:hypothetical protein QC763_0061380 [Podospora pseudopauciseta]